MNSMLRSVVSLYSAVLLTSVAVNADTLTLLDQRILHGTVVGASAQTIHFQVNGRIQEFAVPNVLSLAFNQETALDTSRVKPAPGNDRGVIIGTDADLMVHLPGRIPTNIGSSFKAVLAEDLRAGKVLVAPAWQRGARTSRQWRCCPRHIETGSDNHSSPRQTAADQDRGSPPDGAKPGTHGSRDEQYGRVAEHTGGVSIASTRFYSAGKLLAPRRQTCCN